MATATKLRQQADAAMSDRQWQDAMSFYAKLQEAGEYADDETFKGSFALACLQAGDFPGACRWAGEAIKLGSKTAHFIRGSAVLEVALRRPNMRLAELQYAQRDLQRVVKFFPGDAHAGKKLEECNGFIVDLEQNPPDFFPLDLRDSTTQPKILRARRCAAFLKEEFEIRERVSGKRLDMEWKLHADKQLKDRGPVAYTCPPADFVDDPDFPVGAIYVSNRDADFPDFKGKELLVVWKDADADETQQEEVFVLHSLGEVVVQHLGEGRLLNLGPSVDEFCLKEPEDCTSRTSRVGFDANIFWTLAVFWKALGTTGVKPWDEEIATIKVEGIPELAESDSASLGTGRSEAPPPVSPDSSKSPVELKASGNRLFKQKRWQEAVSCYESALQQCTRRDEELAVALHSNLAQCYLNLDLYRRAVDSATACLRLDWRNQKALFRRALAHEHLRQYQEALEDLEAVLKCDPGQVEALNLRESIKKAVAEPKRGAMPDTRGWQAVQGVSEGSTDWCAGLRPEDRYEWFVQCYRLHLHEGCEGLHSDDPLLRGLFTLGAKRGTVLEDWLVFCKLAARRHILPKDWDWPAVLDVASQRICQHLPAEYIKANDERLRTIRTAANLIYGQSGEFTLLTQEVKSGLQKHDPNLFDDFGGASVWHRLLRRLPEPASKRDR